MALRRHGLTHADVQFLQGCVNTQEKRKKLKEGFSEALSKFSLLTLSPPAAEWDVNVALLPSTVRLPKMFWMAHVVKCLGDAGARMLFDDLKMRSFMYENIIKRSGVKVRGERKNSVAPVTYALVMDKQGLWLLHAWT